MNRTIIASVIALSMAYLLGMGDAQVYMTLATAAYMLLGSLTWLFTRRLPAHFIANLLLIFLGPMALVAILNVVLGSLLKLEGHSPAALLLGIIVLSAYLGHRLWRGKSQRLI